MRGKGFCLASLFFGVLILFAGSSTQAADERNNAPSAQIAPTASIPGAANGKEIARDNNGRYIKYANNVVLDTKTNLEWFAGPDKDTNYDEAKAWVKNLTAVGGNWRMPMIEELRGLYQPGSLHLTPLLETAGGWVWSGEEIGTTHARDFSFSSGTDRSFNRSHANGNKAFAVRFHVTPESAAASSPPALSGPAIKEQNGQYIKYENGVVLDTASRLEWFVGPDKDMTYDKAQAWVNDLTIAGGNWRMPKVSELRSLYQRGLSRRNITPLLEITGWYVWSGEECGAAQAKYFGFNYGNISCSHRGTYYLNRALAVRYIK